MSSESFGQRLRAGIAEHGHLCVGIDPHPELLSDWGLDVTADGAREFGMRVIEAAAGLVAIVKPQVSFFERYGSTGMAALEDVMTAARAAGLMVIADAKRGDIGSTMDAYAQAWLTPGSALEADALTVNPFLGVGTLHGTFTRAAENGKGVFVLVATSNPEGAQLQRASLRSGATVSGAILDDVSEHNRAVTPEGEWGSIGVVIGATVDWSSAGLTAPAPVTPILAPGFGHQGAAPSELGDRFGESAAAVIASESRSILAAGPARIRDTIATHARAFSRTHG